MKVKAAIVHTHHSKLANLNGKIEKKFTRNLGNLLNLPKTNKWLPKPFEKYTIYHTKSLKFLWNLQTKYLKHKLIRWSYGDYQYPWKVKLKYLRE